MELQHPHGPRAEHDGRGARPAGNSIDMQKALRSSWASRWCPSPPPKRRASPTCSTRSSRPSTTKSPMPQKMDFCTGAVHTRHPLDRAHHRGPRPGCRLPDCASPPPSWWRATSRCMRPWSWTWATSTTSSTTSSSRWSRSLGTDREAALADMRYSYIEKLCAQTASSSTRRPTSSCAPNKIDRRADPQVSGHPHLPAASCLVIFWLTFGVIGAPPAGPAGRGDRPLPPPGFGDLLTRDAGQPRGCTPSSSTGCARGWAASSPSCPSSCCCSSSCPSWRTAATWPGWPLSWISCCARSAFPAAASCPCSSASAARCPPSWPPAPSPASGTGR